MGEVDWPALREMLRERGAEFYAGPDGSLRLRDPNRAVGPALLAMLREFRAEAEHEAYRRWRRRVRRLDTGAVVACWEPLEGHSDWEHLQRAADANPGAVLAMETYEKLGEGGNWQWREFARVVGA